MSRDEPGIVVARQSSSSEDNEQQIDLRRDAAFQFVDVAQPSVVVAPGFSTTRRQNLFKTVRPFVREAFQDLTCPTPDN